MHLLETLKTAINALLLNKARSFLTMLGVIIGVFSVVTLVSVVQGFQNYITDQFSALGSNTVIVGPGGITTGDPSKAYSSNKLENKHYDLLKLNSSDKVLAIAPSIRLSKDATYKTKTYLSTIFGTTQSVVDIGALNVDKGRFYTDAEDTAKARVVVLGSEVVKQLFGTRSPIGERIKVEKETFQVIGTVASKGSSFDDRIYMPIKTTENAFNLTNISSIVLKTKNAGDVDTVIKETELILMKDLKKDDFTVFSSKDILTSINNILSMVSVGLGAIAGISLLVGGIGIMNIMLVSVTERTREIGLRKALGATSGNIGLQFVIESVLLSVLGGLVGLGLGWLATFAVQSFVRAEVPWWAIVLALGFSLTVGVVFGTYPAVNASKKDPIEALRFE